VVAAQLEAELLSGAGALQLAVEQLRQRRALCFGAQRLGALVGVGGLWIGNMNALA
jgi:hypothetical protein